MRKAGPRTQPNVRSYTAAIAACGRARKWEEAVALHSKLREEGLTPDQASFNAVIRAARYAYGAMLRGLGEAKKWPAVGRDEPHVCGAFV